MREYSYVKRAMLRQLSTNSRVSVTDLAKKIKCSRNTIISNMKTLEKDFGLSYTIEFNKEVLNFVHNNIWTIKFGKKPTTDELRKIFQDDERVTFVAKTEGDFDLVVKMISESSEKYLYWGMKTVNKLLNYRPYIKPSFVALRHMGFTALPTETLEKIDISYLGIDELDRKLLILLNDNSRYSYKTMARKIKEDVETVRYRVKKLSKSKIIRRYTAVLKSPPTEYNMVFFMNYEMAPGIIKRYDDAYKYYTESEPILPLINDFQYLALTSGSYFLFGLGCFDDEEESYKKVIKAHMELYKEDNPTMYQAKVVQLIKGYLPIRNIDMKKEYNALDWSQVR